MARREPRQRKRKVRLREASTDKIPPDSNRELIVPLSKAEQEERQRLRQELKGPAKISSKKQKRLNTYIETKLRKDGTQKLLQKLTAAKVDVGAFQSTKNLGKRKYGDFMGDKWSRNDASESDQESTDSFELRHPQPELRQTINRSLAHGSGLKQPLERGSDGLPVITTKRKKTFTLVSDSSEDQWDGFSDDQGQPPGDDETSQSSGDEDQESLSTSSIETENRSKIKPRNSAFKAWATQQINSSLGHIPYQQAEPNIVPAAKASTTPKEPVPERPSSVRKAFAVSVSRLPEIEEARSKLPIVAEEAKVMEAIHNNDCTIIWGATGSGKTTQIPQFLLEAGYGARDGPTPGMIGITQPRRVAAVSMAKRVGQELGDSGRVAFQIRFENTATSGTAIKFMTDGILLREIAQDFSLQRYSIIIVDEAHERSVNTDILIGMLTRIVELRRTTKPLKLVIMSATLRVSDFLQNARLFPLAPPLVQAEGRQFPVTTHFARTTQRDYLEETFKKVSRGHRKLPPGGMLVFLTGQDEIRELLKRLREELPVTNAARDTKEAFSATDGPLEAEDIDLDLQTPQEWDDFESGPEEDEFRIDAEPFTPINSVHLLPLFSQLPTIEQLRVFQPVSEGSRLIVLATNVAETSLTIPGIRYVFDCGRSKERVYDSGVQKYEIGFISKASAEQRAGRAGRTGPGHCYRLYSSAVYERDFVEHAEPEILRTPIEGVVLQLKAMGLDNVTNFPFPSPPSQDSLGKAEILLKRLGAVSATGSITRLGQSLSVYPVSPRHAKMLAIGSQHGCLPYIITLVSGLAIGNVFTSTSTAQSGQHPSFTTFSRHDPTSDSLKLLTAICASSHSTDPDFASQMSLNPKALTEISQLRKHLSAIIHPHHPLTLSPTYNALLPPPTPTQCKAINQIIAASYIDQIAIRASSAPSPPAALSTRAPKRAIDVPYLSLSPTSEQAVYIHPSSVLAQLSTANTPQYIVYSHLQTTDVPGAKVRMFPLVTVAAGQIGRLAEGTGLLRYGKPVGKVEMVEGGRVVWLVPFLGVEGGIGMGWPLPAVKVLQRREVGKTVQKEKGNGDGWVVEKILG